MPLPGILASIGAPVLTSVAGSLVSGLLGSRGQSAADRRLSDAMALYSGIKLPELKDYSPEMVKYLGDLQAQMGQQAELGPTAFEQIQIDPRLRQAQMRALEQMAGISEKGMTDADLAALEMIRRSSAGEAQAKQGQIMQEMQARGQGGSGAELIARLVANEQAADRLSEQGMQKAQMMEQARRAAIESAAQMGKEVRSQDYGQESERAQARDIINKFNVQNLQDIYNTYGQRQFQAQERNIAAKQALETANVGTRNQAQLTQNEIERQRFLDRMAKAGSMAGVKTAQAESARQSGAAQAGGVADITKGLLQTFAGSKTS